MPQLTLSFLGTIETRLDGVVLTGFRSDKVRALLAYLAVEADRPHRRARLAGLFWPEWKEAEARTYLRQALANLQTLLVNESSSGLLITRDTLQWHPAMTDVVDVLAFERNVILPATLTPPPLTVSTLQKAVTLYRGSFLEGFFLNGCPEFEEWVLLTRVRLQQKMVAVLTWLADYYQRQQVYHEAIPYARRRVELEPTTEEAHQPLIRLLALAGQRSAAVSQFELCRIMLRQELGVEPAAATMALYQQILRGELTTLQQGPLLAPLVPLASLPDAPHQPDFLKAPATSHRTPAVVARQVELAQLERMMAAANEGQGAVAFVTGDAGYGKTALLHAFARRAHQGFPTLIAATGNCNAHTGVGDPYLPFCEILTMLIGQVEARWAAGLLTSEEALRLWQLTPLVLRLLIEQAPDLIDTFVPAGLVSERVAAMAATDPHLANLSEEIARRRATKPGGQPRQDELFAQYTAFLQQVAQQQPLLLVLDDLQWADAGSINLLFHLGRQVVGSRILIVGAYRPTDVKLGRAAGSQWGRHPLEPVVNELKRTYGDVEVDLLQVDGRAFVDAFVDTEPNHFDADFRQMLYAQTEGHPLFTVELLRGMQERGDLVQDGEGYWQSGATLDWDTLPARVEAVIGERIRRLPDDLQRLLAVASVEGEFFTAEVLSAVLPANQAAVMRWLSEELERRHRLVRAQGIERLGPQRFTRYRFGHILFQRYLHQHLDPVERVDWHEAVGNTLETLYRSQVADLTPIASLLAHHFVEAGLLERAIPYLRMAGYHALRLSANEEAITHLTQARILLQSLPENEERQRLELDLCLLVGPALMANRGYTAPQVLEIYSTAHKLCQIVGTVSQQLQTLWGLRAYYHVSGSYRRSLQFVHEFMAIVQNSQTAHLLVEAHRNLGTAFFHLGQLEEAASHLEAAVALYDQAQHHELMYLYGQDPGVSAYSFLALTQWQLGYPDRAIRSSLAGVALAQRLNHPFTLTYALNNVVLVSQPRRDLAMLQEYIAKTLAISTKQGFTFWTSMVVTIHGWVLTQQHQIAEGITEIQRGLALAQSLQSNWSRPFFLLLLADAYRCAGQVEAGLQVVQEALEDWRTDDLQWDAELYRVQGELLLRRNDQEFPAAGEMAVSCFLQALEIAQQQGAKSLELRAATSLARLWQQQGKIEDAHQLLAPVYGWFTEGFDTRDLQEAKALLEELRPLCDTPAG